MKFSKLKDINSKWLKKKEASPGATKATTAKSFKIKIIPHQVRVKQQKRRVFLAQFNPDSATFVSSIRLVCFIFAQRTITMSANRA